MTFLIDRSQPGNSNFFKQKGRKMQNLIDQIVDEFKSNPRNKIFINEEILIASVKEETGDVINSNQLRSIIAKYINGDMNEAEQSLYDGAVYACGLTARRCFNEDPDDDLDYEIQWLEGDDGSYTAEVSPS